MSEFAFILCDLKRRILRNFNTFTIVIFELISHLRFFIVAKSYIFKILKCDTTKK